MKYHISYTAPQRHFIDIEMTVEKISGDFIFIQMPAWRPGRYELQNYARNILGFEVLDKSGKPVLFEKETREKWKVNTKGKSSLRVKYRCYCVQMDAGGAWLDEDQLYLNFLYCLMYIPGREQEACQVELDLPENFEIACGLKKKKNILFAKDYYKLADCPLIASPSLIHKTYKAGSTLFHIWIQGDCNPDWPQILSDFKKFSEEQIKTMGSCPEPEYHFLFQILPYRHYHGVEHRNSTVITIGPSELLNTENLYREILSISCHELFHAWNIVKIRPAEMMPYDFSKENYFKSGFIAEGVTTYYGEYFLGRSGVFNQETFFAELDLLFRKHFECFGNEGMSVADASFDLWIDGYVPGVPGRKVSIYTKGAVIALILDLEIRKATSNKRSLDDVMKYLWDHFGKKEKGYTIADYQMVVEKISGQSFKSYFDECVFGKGNLRERLDKALKYIGCMLQEYPVRPATERIYGFRTVWKENKSGIEAIAPGSPADKFLALEDEIISVNEVRVNANINEVIGEKRKIVISVFRNKKLKTFTMEGDKKNYFTQYRISKRKDAGKEEKNNFKRWMNSDF